MGEVMGTQDGVRVLGTWANIRRLRERLSSLESHLLVYWDSSYSEEWRSRGNGYALSRDDVVWLIAESKFAIAASDEEYRAAGRRLHTFNRKKLFTGRGW